MIVPMKKVWVFTTETDRTDTVERLKDVGVLHVQKKSVHTDRLADLLQKRQTVERAISVLPIDAAKSAKSNGAVDAAVALPEDPLPRALANAAELIELQENLNSVHETAERLGKERISLEAWGNFDPQDVRSLALRGVSLHLFAFPTDEFAAFPTDVPVILLERTKKLVRFVAVTENEHKVPGWDEFPLPERGLSVVNGLIGENLAEQQALQQQIEQKAGYLMLLEAAVRTLNEQIEFETVHEGMETEGIVRFLAGFVPEPSVDRLRIAARDYGWGLLIADPGEDEEVPTETRNPRWIAIIKPLFNLLGTIPGYHERDISIWFLGFFTIFFAMIIGDAGYGFIILIPSIYAIIRAKRSSGRVGDAWILMVVLSTVTIIWGAITGTWFGLKGIADAVPFRYLVVPQISIFASSSTQIVQFICFLLAVAQLTLAHIWNFFTELRGKYPIRALAQLGWLAIVLGAYNVALNLVISQSQYPIMSISWYGAAAGLFLVLVFGEQTGNFLKGLRSGLNVARVFTTLLNSISAFADIVSYIRLFAVGLATVAIAQSFNSMAAGMAQSGIGGIIGAVVVVLLGHTLNLLMGALAVIVHGVRLNVLEFSNHLGLEWKGSAYRPFARTVQ